MSDGDILEKAIEKAIDGGWTPRVGLVAFKPDRRSSNDNTQYVPIDYRIEALIFNHDFAKALWGGDRVKHSDIYPHDEWNASEILHDIAWQYHLQCMAISDDRIKYLGEHLDD